MSWTCENGHVIDGGFNQRPEVCFECEVERLRSAAEEDRGKAVHDAEDIQRMESEIAALQAIEDAARLVLFDYRVNEEWESEAMGRLAGLLDARPAADDPASEVGP